MASVLEYVNKKYGFSIVTIDSDIVMNSLYELIDMMIEQNKRSLDLLAVNYTGLTNACTKNVYYVLSCYTSSGIPIDITNKLEYLKSTTSSTGNIYSRPVFKNIGYINGKELIIANTGNIILAYIPDKSSGVYSYNGATNVFTGYEAFSSLIASVYAKNLIIKDFATIIKTTPTTFSSVKALLDARLASDDVEIAGGYLNALSIENTTPQAIIALQNNLMELILKDIQSELGGLQ